MGNPAVAAAALLVALGLGLGAAGAATQEAPGDESGVEWRTNLDEARKEAAETGKPLLVVFR